MDDGGYPLYVSSDDEHSHMHSSDDDELMEHMDETELFLRALLSPIGALHVTQTQVLQIKETKGPVEKLTNLGARFPLDIVYNILTYVEGNWLARAVRVCKAWYKCLNTEEFWQEKFKLEFERASSRFYMCHWHFQSISKERVSKFLSYKRSYAVVFAAKIMGKCNYCNKHPGDYYGDSNWRICKKCSDVKLSSKDDVKRKYCLSEEEMKDLVFFRMPPTIVSFNEVAYLNEELEIYVKKIFNDDVEGELKKRRKVFTTYDKSLIEQFLSKRMQFYDQLTQSLKTETKYVPHDKIAQIIQRFMYDASSNEQSEEKVRNFIKHWDTLYHKYTVAIQAFEEAFNEVNLSPAIRQDIVIPIAEPINTNVQSYDHIRLENTLLGADDKRSFQTVAKRIAREYQYKAASLVELAKQSNNKYTTLDSLCTIAKRELEETCAFRRLPGGDVNEIFVDAAKMSTHITATVKRVLEFNAREEALSNHLSQLGYNYKFMSMPKEVIDYVVGKSDLTFHQVVMKAIKDYTNPYADHNFIYNSMRFLSPQDKKTIACELYKKMLMPQPSNENQDENDFEKRPRAAGDKRREKQPAVVEASASDSAVAKLKIVKGRKRRTVTRMVLQSMELASVHKYIRALMDEQQQKNQKMAVEQMQE